MPAAAVKGAALDLGLDLEFRRPVLYDKQFRAIYDARRISVIEATVKSGKTVGAITWLVEMALGGKDGQNYWWIAPVSDQALIAFRRTMRALPHDLFVPNISLKTITLINGAVIWFKSGEHPNCYDNITEILTDHGWKRFRDINADDLVMTRSCDGLAEWQRPTKIISCRYSGEMVTIENGRVDLCVTTNHRTLVERTRGALRRGKWDRNGPRIGRTALSEELIVNADQIKGSDRIPAWADWEGNDREEWSEDKCALLGFYLAEGSAIWNSSDRPRERVKRSGYRIHFAQTAGIKGGTKGDVRVQFSDLLTKLGLKYKERKDGLLIWNKELWNTFIDLGNKYSKRIPAHVKNLPRAKLRTLLHWMILGDGWIRDKDCGYFTVSRQLADDVQEIVIKCGWSATIREREPAPFLRPGKSPGPGVVGYIVKIQKHAKSHRLRCTKTGSYIGRVPYDGIVYCCSVPNGVVLVRRNGKPIWSGNSLYGEDVYAAVIDEASRCREDAWFAVRSTLTYTRGPIRIIGNVRGRKTWAYRLARRAEQGDAEMGYHKIVAQDAVDAGVLDAKEIEDAKSQLPENVFRELYLAEASDDGGNPFGLQHIRGCVVPELSKGKPVAWGWDLAKRQDYTVGVALDRAGYVCRFVRLQKIPWDQIIDAIVRETDAPALVDSTGVGDPVLDLLQKRRPGVFEGYWLTAQSKQRLMEGLAVVIQSRGVTYPDGPIARELEQFEFQVTRTSVRYSAPEGYFDDSVIALALAVYHKQMAPAAPTFTADVVRQLRGMGARGRRT